MPVVSRFVVVYLTSFVAIAPSFWTKDQLVASRTDKSFNKALDSVDTLANMEDKDLNAYLNRKAAGPRLGTGGFRP